MRGKMCQVTLIDIDSKTNISRAFIRPLTEINATGIVKKSNQENKDGFGYMTFTKAPEIIKSVLDAEEWWEKHEDEFMQSVRNANGIYHVRSASITHGTTIYGADAHPHKYGDIVLVHNGTLKETKKMENDKRFDNLFPKQKRINYSNLEVDVPMIDSEKFVRTLATICGEDKLNVDHIKDAVSLFTGPFVFLIYDAKQPKKIFVVRGRDKDLHKAIIKNGNEVIGMVLNTGNWELSYWASLVKTSIRVLTKDRLEVDIEEVPKESIFIYELGSYDLGEKVAEIQQTVESRPAIKNVVHYHKTNVVPETPEHSDPVWQKVVEKSRDLGLTLKELMLISEIVLGRAIHIIGEKDMEFILKILGKLDGKTFKGRTKEWDNLRSKLNLSHLAAYKNTNIQFPYMLNSKKDLQNARERRGEVKH